MSAEILPPTTAGIYPERFSDHLFFTRNRTVLTILLVILMIAGFGLRVWNLGAESLGEDELNKFQTVAEYRTNGLSGRNGEHPFLMKGLQTVSIIASEKLNQHLSPNNRIPDEAALRFPTALFGTFTILLLYLLIAEFFGSSIGLIAASLWAVDPVAIGFDRVAKEDSFLLFFFLLAGFFWVRAQSRAERSENNWIKYVWLAAIGFGGMVASKYLPYLIAVTAAYYQIFQGISATKWRLGKRRWIIFYVIIGVSFLIFNPTIMLPDTWREMLTFSGEKRIGHDSYEFMGVLYQNKVTAWLTGVPWTFYYIFIAVKTPLLTLIFFFVGLPLAFRRKLGDGRFFIFFWAFMWFMPFSVIGGKFTRYFTVAEPLVLITAAIGFYFLLSFLSEKISKNLSRFPVRIFQAVCFTALILFSLISSIFISPHFRLHTNALGGGMNNAGFYFPHDEFYDASIRETVAEIAKTARPGALVANETPGLFEYYARKEGREDLKFISLTDKAEVRKLAAGDFIIAARGRRYFSNDAYLKYLDTTSPISEIKMGEVPYVKIYQLNENTLPQIQKLAE